MVSYLHVEVDDVVAMHVTKAIAHLSHEAHACALGQHKLLTDDAVEQLSAHDPVRDICKPLQNSRKLTVEHPVLGRCELFTQVPGAIVCSWHDPHELSFFEYL